MTTQIQPGDWVVLTRGGVVRPAAELMAIWTVQSVTETQAAVVFDPAVQVVSGLAPLSPKRYPLDWLVSYPKPLATDELA